MSNGTFAKEELVEDYLTALLTEEVPEKELQRENVAKLLETANVVENQKEVTLPTENLESSLVEVKESAALVDKQEALPVNKIETAEWEIPTTSFQALFFNVAGLTLALPLTELGGIHKIQKIGPLFGKPNWFKGVMLHREEKLSVVDTAMWVMPEKYNQALAESLKYQYLIMLDSSSWGLACESLVTTATLAPNDVKWREANGKRPWLAGMVKEKMCALVNVKQLVKLLNKGQGSNGK
ncbi:chemotaxis protein CheW [Aliiglaciecola lipolytica]|uniref:Purine-binding chemotaxis protein CheW n=1 Tax=Aliiglaciecola lipolytica E3 TaxID=1127673 RepID=K6YCF6_9ALTE|nr:chemotaxis protein CheW [Aliiglaciecola lipolytica]GAC15867.1 purine-binding chemotaxis protein CheW [Aliiglaciecola lipolytica E3]